MSTMNIPDTSENTSKGDIIPYLQAEVCVVVETTVTKTVEEIMGDFYWDKSKKNNLTDEEKLDLLKNWHASK